MGFLLQGQSLFAQAQRCADQSGIGAAVHIGQQCLRGGTL